MKLNRQHKPDKDYYQVENKINQYPLQDMRIIRTNLVYLSGLPQKLANEKILRQQSYMGQYGNVKNVILNNDIEKQSTQNSFVAYINYSHPSEAALAILDEKIYIDFKKISNDLIQQNKDRLISIAKRSKMDEVFPSSLQILYNLYPQDDEISAIYNKKKKFCQKNEVNKIQQNKQKSDCKFKQIHQTKNINKKQLSKNLGWFQENDFNQDMIIKEKQNSSPLTKKENQKMEQIIEQDQLEKNMWDEIQHANNQEYQKLIQNLQSEMSSIFGRNYIFNSQLIHHDISYLKSHSIQNINEFHSSIQEAFQGINLGNIFKKQVYGPTKQRKMKYDLFYYVDFMSSIQEMKKGKLNKKVEIPSKIREIFKNIENKQMSEQELKSSKNSNCSSFNTSLSTQEDSHVFQKNESVNINNLENNETQCEQQNLDNKCQSIIENSFQNIMVIN